MNTQNRSKLKNLLALHKPGTVVLPKWLEEIGISRDLQKVYKRNGWLASLGTGAFIKPDDDVSWRGALFTIQKQAGLSVHVGAVSSLSLQGLSHYVRFSQEQILLFSPRGVKLPRWFVEYSWSQSLLHVRTTLFPENMALTEYLDKGFSITVSTPERAIMECLYLTPKKMDIIECYHLMEGLSNLRPKVVQELLEKCTSVKVKRLFLFMATKAKHQWLNYVDHTKIDLGKGDRSILPGGVFNATFHISVPKELAE
ncbi:type IV toxin-antitoxin system AbiEi family antitoxin [Pseudochryseolinea flava]|uniref:Transcriptional regulator AbiEi antitoxin N-terminal domain-containing protein n=1 Tax=Pseudochryseolinea flava TaxID=2059302 RepID=A0A364Y7Y7_9BACT|nr:type IV toxin-antitoxin system AbiEi family antitoxin [Pseudochryseolinea flava]RAW02595.1 hypothetical protein DQQ10_00315 [Pseudochryseolinea flava]